MNYINLIPIIIKPLIIKCIFSVNTIKVYCLKKNNIKYLQEVSNIYIQII